MIANLFSLAVGFFIAVVGLYSFRKMWQGSEDVALRIQSVAFLIVVMIDAGWIIGDALRGLLAPPPM